MNKTIGKYCQAGGVPCEHFKENKEGNFEGWCYADSVWCVEFGNKYREILTTDTQCPCPQLQKEVESKFDKFIEELDSFGWGLGPSDVEQIRLSLKKVGIKYE